MEIRNILNCYSQVCRLNTLSKGSWIFSLHNWALAWCRNGKDGKGVETGNNWKRSYDTNNQTRMKYRESFFWWVLSLGEQWTRDRGKPSVCHCLKWTQIIGLDTTIPITLVLFRAACWSAVCNEGLSIVKRGRKEVGQHLQRHKCVNNQTMTGRTFSKSVAVMVWKIRVSHSLWHLNAWSQLVTVWGGLGCDLAEGSMSLEADFENLKTYDLWICLFCYLLED